MSPNFTPTIATHIGFLFGSILRDWLTAGEREEILLRNAAEENRSICHSHDFCDPNQAMLDACELLDIKLEVNDGRFSRLVNAAWPIGIAMLDDRLYADDYGGKPPLTFQFLDVEDDRPAVELFVEAESRGLDIRFPGYGDKSSIDGAGTPVYIEFRESVPHVIVHADINNEEPTHVISLKDAAETNRSDQTC